MAPFRHLVRFIPSHPHIPSLRKPSRTERDGGKRACHFLCHLHNCLFSSSIKAVSHPPISLSSVIGIGAYVAITGVIGLCMSCNVSPSILYYHNTDDEGATHSHCLYLLSEKSPKIRQFLCLPSPFRRSASGENVSPNRNPQIDFNVLLGHRGYDLHGR